MEWREVSAEEFHRDMATRDVHPTPIGKWPYTSEFRTPAGIVRGKTVDVLTEGSGLPERHYFLP